MLSYILPICPQEVVRLLEAELATTYGQPELCYSIWEDYLIEEDFDRGSLGITDAEAYSLVSIDAVLNIEPRLEQNYWVLKIVVHRDLGPQKGGDTATFIGATLTLAQFTALLADPQNLVAVRLDVSTSFGREHFNDWLDELEARHPGEGGIACAQTATTAANADRVKTYISFFRDRALREKDLCDRIVAWNKRSSARVDQRLDRIRQIVGGMVTRVMNGR